MEIIDNKKICIIEGCENIGEWSCESYGRILRRKLCSKHRRETKKNYLPSGRNGYAREKFKRDSCEVCEYCGWEGPCDCHRPNLGRYTKDNMRSTCPNCHRLITMGLLVDKFK